MKLPCSCGSVISDTTDFLPNKGHFIADRDWEDFVTSIVPPYRIDISLVRYCYQCKDCGNLYMQSPQQPGLFHAFTPVGKYPPVLQSSKGDAWRAPMIGYWDDRSKGSLWCDAEGGADYRIYTDWDQLENAYYSLFDKMRKLDRIRHSILRKNGVDLHTWDLKA